MLGEICKKRRKSIRKKGCTDDLGNWNIQRLVVDGFKRYHKTSVIPCGRSPYQLYRTEWIRETDGARISKLLESHPN